MNEPTENINEEYANENGKCNILELPNQNILIGEAHAKNQIDQDSQECFNAELAKIDKDTIVVLESTLEPQKIGISKFPTYMEEANTYAKKLGNQTEILDTVETTESVLKELQALNINITQEQLEKVEGISFLYNNGVVSFSDVKDLITPNFASGIMLAHNSANNEPLRQMYNLLASEIVALHIGYIRDERFRERISDISKNNPNKKLFIVVGQAHTQNIVDLYSDTPTLVPNKKRDLINMLIKELKL